MLEVGDVGEVGFFRVVKNLRMFVDWVYIYIYMSLVSDQSRRIGERSSLDYI